jgi:hypothetical protein
MGCGGPGQTVPLSVSTESVQVPAKAPHALRIAVVPFDVLRLQKDDIGRWQHYVETRVDRLVSAQGSAADQITGFVVEYLQHAGFQVIRVKSAETVAPGTFDVILTGQIEEYWNEAVTKFSRTRLSTLNRLSFNVSNVFDKITVHSAVEGHDVTKAVFFDIADLEHLNNSVLGDSVAQFLTSVSVKDRTLKAKN